MRILIVEDQALLAYSLSEALVAAGHEVVGEAASSAAAIRLLDRKRPELALVDIDLECRGAGLHVAAYAKRKHGIAVLLTTGQPELARTCNYALGLISKPYDPSDVVSAVPVIVDVIGGKEPSPLVPTALELFRRAENASGPATPELAPLLLVEDHPADIELALAALRRCRVANPIAIARDGEEALDMLCPKYDSAPEDFHPALVLLDIKLPRRDGHEVLEQLKADSRLRSIPVFMLTASQHERDVQRSFEHGADGYITKPHSFDEFCKAMNRIGQYVTVSSEEGMQSLR